MSKNSKNDKVHEVAARETEQATEVMNQRTEIPPKPSTPPRTNVGQTYRLTVPHDQVQHDVNRYVAHVSGYQPAVIAHAAIMCKAQLMRFLDLLGGYAGEITVTVTNDGLNVIDVVYDFTNHDVFFRYTSRYADGTHRFTALVMQGERSQSFIDLTSVDTEWFSSNVDLPTKLCIIHNFDVISKFIDGCWNELVMTERRVETFANAVIRQKGGNVNEQA